MPDANAYSDFTHPSTKEAVSNFLDDIGKSIPEEFFQGINHYFTRSLNVAPEHHHHLLKTLGIGFSFVFDTNPIQEILRRELLHKNSDVFEGMRIGNIVAIAPFDVDDEITEHIPNIAKDCNVTPLEALKVYHHVVRPHIHFMSLESLTILEKVKSEIRDRDDAPFVVLFLEKKPLGIVTRDKDIKEFDGTKCFDLKEVGKMHVDYRKRETATLIVCGFFLFLYGFLKLGYNFAKGLVAFIKKHPWISLAVLLLSVFIVLFVCYQKSEKIKKYLIDKWNSFKAGAKKVFAAIGPYVAEFSIQVLTRISDSNANTKQLLSASKKDGTPLRLKSDPMRQTLSVEELIKHVFAAFQHPLKFKEITDALKFLDLKNRGAEDLKREIRKALKQKELFFRDSKGFYFFSGNPIPR